MDKMTYATYPEPKNISLRNPFTSSKTPSLRTVILIFICLVQALLFKTIILENWFRQVPAARSKGFQWQHVTPSRTLEYTECYDGFQCARLDVPLDWNNTDGPRALMAITKLPAKVPVHDPRYGGIIILNPGGPGGSGVAAVLRRGRGIQIVVDSDVDVSEFNIGDSSETNGYLPKYFDIMSFDPRGIINSSPKLNSTFPDDFSQYRWEIEGEYISLATDFEKVYTRSRTLSASLSHQPDPETGIGRFTNTSPVVADMVEFIEQHGNWREEEARRYLASIQGRKQIRGYRALESQILERTRWRKGEEKLQYWGFSYGTVLGATFSAMQPHRVGRIILDGNVALADYYRGDWLHNLQDSDAIVDKTVEYCHESGPDSCPLYESNASAITEKLDTLMSSLKVSPKGVPASESRGPEIITYSEVYSFVKERLYSPLRDFHFVAILLQDLAVGNGSAFADFKAAETKAPCLASSDSSCEPVDDQRASSSILCTDGESKVNMTKEEFKAYFSELMDQSKWIGVTWAEIQLSCTNWNLRPKWRFAGPIAGNTSHPLLLLNPTLDAVTPIANAHTTAKLFNGSIVLEQNSEGHCTYAAPSICTGKHVRNYFQSGDLPPPNTVCLPERRPFIGSIRSPDAPDLSPGDKRLLDALEELTAVGA